jgi:hypothetical protein
MLMKNEPKFEQVLRPIARREDVGRRAVTEALHFGLILN